MKARKTPQRTCIACATGDEKRDLVRFVRSSDGDVVVDVTGRANGRGAYVCANMECFETAVTRRRLNAALRVNLREDDTDRLRREFEAALAERAASQQGR